MFLCQNDEYQPTTERQPKRNVYFLTPQATVDQTQGRTGSLGGGDEGMGERGRIELRTRLF